MGRHLSALLATLVLCSACGGSGGGGGAATDWSQQSSASGGGGMTPLIQAAEHEGEVEVPAPARGGPAFAALVDGFESRYRVRVVTLPTADDAAQLAAPALDVYDVAVDTAAANTARFAPYLVFYWLQIPADMKDARAYWYGSCGGLMSVGGATAPVAQLSELLDSSASVGLAGTPPGSNDAVAAVVTAALANGGSADDVAPGVDFFHSLAARGAFSRGPATAVFDWNYVFGQSRHFVPPATVLAYDAQAVSRHAAHPAAARLWEEYLLSDTGQNLCVTHGARPSRLDAMRSAGVLDVSAAAALDPVPPHPVLLTPAQMAAARAYLEAHWSAAVGA